jgi:membrane protease YdiL (CAAX protease family)
MIRLAARSERYDAWVAAMAPRATPWRVLAGVGIAGAIWVVAIGSALGLAAAWGLDPARGRVVLYLLSFAALIGGLGLAMRSLHHLPGALLLGPEGRLEHGPFLRGVAVVAGIVAVGLVPMLLLGRPAPQQDPLVWPLWLLPALPALFVQVAAEEVVFRGYLQGMLAARSANRLVWWVVPALVFGALHWNPAELGENAGLMVAAAVLMGLVLGDVTARTGGLSLAIGLHFANNAYAMLVMATPSALSGLALWLSPLDPDDPAMVRAALIGNIVLIALAYGVWLVIRGRR